MKHLSEKGTGGLYVGLLSGTSIDGVDAALVRVDRSSIQTLCTRSHEIAQPLRARLLRLTEAKDALVEDIGSLDREFGMVCAEAVLELIRQAGVSAVEVVAIGSHGQTIRHRPEPLGQTPGFTWQIGDPNTIAELTGICTVADFRRRDVAAGGQGAPLVPAFHDAVFRQPGISRVIANIGGIANITLLPGSPGSEVAGFDTGPGNVMLDGWIRRHQQRDYDAGGIWASSGQVSRPLLASMLRHPFLSRAAPKSTGREDFNLDWLDAQLQLVPVDPAEDVQATLLEFTALTLSTAVKEAMPDCLELYLCGGGARNDALCSRIAHLMGPGVAVGNTGALGVEPDWVEACAFAWMAWRTLRGESANLPGVTGANRAVCLGGIYPGRLRPLRLQGE